RLGSMLKIGERAPELTGQTSDGRQLTLSSLRGKKVVVYFYPKSFTPGCTAETKNFRDNYEDLKALGAEVIGISTDDLATQCRFAAEHRLSFPLIADSSHVISTLFGVMWPIIPIDKRVTFIIDEHG